MGIWMVFSLSDCGHTGDSPYKQLTPTLIYLSFWNDVYTVE